MISLRAIVLFFAAMIAVVQSAPTWGHSHHKHVKIIVPEYHHSVHHHHVEKVHVPVHIVKKVHVPVPVVKKVYVHDHHDHDWHGSDWHGSSDWW